MNKATQKLRKKVRENRRLATQIKGLAETGLSGFDNKKITRAAFLTGVRQLLTEIVELATKMDARTGTIDPSAKKQSYEETYGKLEHVGPTKNTPPRKEK